MPNLFVHLHAHSHYSLLNALPSPESLVLRAAEMGGMALALTDTDAMYGVIPFYKAAKAKGIKPIIGLDVHIAPDGRHQKRARIDKRAWRMVLLAENITGYKNLLKLSSLGFLEGFYYTARIDDELLEKYHEGLIALSGGAGGEIPTLLSEGNGEKARTRAGYYSKLFGEDNFFIELVHRPDNVGEIQSNNALVLLAGDLKLPFVATSNASYIHPEDHEAWEALQCIQKGMTVEEYRRMSGEGADYSLAEPETIAHAFQHIPEAISNTVKIAERCSVELDLDSPKLPVFDVPGGKTDAEYLHELAEAGLRKRYAAITDDIRERFEYELSTIIKMGFASYMLIVQDFVNEAKKMGVLVGPGRGSAAGSIVAYSLGITDLDPLKYGLLFERFLNPERVSMPDIDMDFQDNKRALVLDYVSKKYGSDHVAGIITFGSMMPRAAVRDAARVLGLTFQEADKIAKFVPPPVQGRHTPLKIAVKEQPDLRAIYEGDSNARRVLDLAMKIEGTPRHASQHACGIVISDKPLTEYVPIQESQHEDLDFVSQYSLGPVEAAGLVKMDFLGLSNLSIIGQALEIVEAVFGEKIDIERVPLDDKKTYELLGRGETVGVFQFESDGMRKYMVDLKPSEFEDIAAMGALYRPGPLSAGMVPQYINRKHGREKVEYDHPCMEPILKSTYGVTVYQEQIMRVSQALAGFTGGEADTLRKAMGKKKRDVLAKMNTKFIDGCLKNGVSKKIAEKVWHDWEGFADYAFNKSHSASYGLISYRTAYLKAHYPAIFMAAVLNSDAGLIDRMTIEVSECQRIGIEVLPPDVNESFKGFGVVGKENKIRWGLMGIKNVGEEFSAFVVSERKERGPYLNLGDFVSRMSTKHFNKKSFEAFAMTGAFDRFEERGRILANLDIILAFHRQIQLDKERNQQSLFGTASAPGGNLALRSASLATRAERLAWERELLGIYVSEHPYSQFAKTLAPFVKRLAEVPSLADKTPVKVAGVISGVHTILTKKGETMAFVALQDVSYTMEVVMFPRVYSVYRSVLVDGNMVVVSGKVSLRENQAASVLVDTLSCFDEKTIGGIVSMLESGQWVGEETHKETMRIEAESAEPCILISLKSAPTDRQISGLREIFEKRPGKFPVAFSVESAGRQKRIKTSFLVSPTESVVTAIRAIVGENEVTVVGEAHLM
ncbi:MAG: DNA polymerase III subunit alpha [Patescibacteria group bacterium]